MAFDLTGSHGEEFNNRQAEKELSKQSTNKKSSKSISKPKIGIQNLTDKNRQDNGLLILYVPKDPEKIYIARSSTQVNRQKSLGNGRSKIKDTTQVGIAGQNGLINNQAEELDGISSYLNKVDNPHTENVGTVPDPGINDESPTSILLYLQFERFSLPEVFKFGKRASGQTTDIPGGKRQTQITGVFPKTMNFEVIFSDIFAQDNAKVLDAFVGQRTVIFYQETNTNLEVKNKVSKLHEEVKTYLWLGTIMDVDFNYYHRHYVVANVTFEPLKDLSNNRVTPSPQTTVFPPKKVALATKHNKVPSNISVKQNNRRLQQNKLILQAGQDESQNLNQMGETLPDLSLFSIKDSFIQFDKAKDAAEFAKNLAILDPTSVWKGISDWIDIEFVDLIHEANNFIQDCFNRVKSVNGIITGAKDMLEAKLDTLTPLINNAKTLIKETKTLLDSYSIPLQFLIDVKSKIISAVSTLSEIKDLISNPNLLFNQTINNFNALFSTANEEKTEITEAQIKDLVVSLNKFGAIPIIEAAIVTADIKNTIKNLSKAKIRNIEYFQAEDIKKTLQNVLASDTKKQEQLDNAQKLHDDVFNDKTELVDPKTKIAYTPAEALIAKIKKNLEGIAAGEKIVPIDAALADNLKKINIVESTSNITPEQVQILQETSLRMNLVSILEGVVSNKNIEAGSKVLSSTMNVGYKQIPLQNVLIEKYQVTQEDIRKGGYSYIASKYYQNALRGPLLEKYNDKQKLVIGLEIDIPNEFVLLNN